MKASFKVRQDLAFWACDAGQFTPGEVHEVTDPVVIGQVLAAESAGSVTDVVLDAETLATMQAVEPDEVSLEYLAAAQASGAWLEGHLQQAQIETTTIEVGSDDD